MISIPLTDYKMCLVCKQMISNITFNEHFIECRKTRLELEAKKIQGKLTPEEAKIITTKKKNGCGCSKKKRS